MQKVRIKLSIFFANSKLFWSSLHVNANRNSLLSIILFTIIFFFKNWYVSFRHQVLAWTDFYRHSYKLYVKDCLKHHPGINLGYCNNKEYNYCRREAKPRQQRKIHFNFTNL